MSNILKIYSSITDLKKSKKFKNEKEELTYNIRQNMLGKYDIKERQDIIFKEHIELNNVNKVYSLENVVQEFILKIDYRYMLDIDEIFEEVGEFYPCILIEGNMAKVEKNHDNKFFYITKGQEKEYSFNLIDLIKIFYGLNKINAIYYIASQFDINLEEYDYIYNQQSKYIDNIEYITNKLSESSKYKVLYNYIKTGYIETLSEIYNIGLSRVNLYKKNNQSIFYVSRTFIVNKLNEKLSNIQRHMTLLSILGFIKVVEYKDLPAKLYKEVEAISEGNNKNQMYTYFIPEINDDMLDKALDIVISLKKHKVKKNNITEKVIHEIFGLEFAQSVFVANKVETRKNNKNTMISKEQLKILEEQQNDEVFIPF